MGYDCEHYAKHCRHGERITNPCGDCEREASARRAEALVVRLRQLIDAAECLGFYDSDLAAQLRDELETTARDAGLQTTHTQR